MPNQVIPLLINKSDFTSDKLIPDNTDPEKVNKSIRDAQQFDLRPLTGDDFYYDLVKNYQASKAIVTYTNLAVDTFSVGETIEADNGAIGKVVTDIGGVLTLEIVGPISWAGALTITGAAGLATADITLVTFSNVDKYNKLIQGEEYVNTSGNPILFPGLRMVIKYYAMARFRATSQSTVTSHSNVMKTNQYSVPLDRDLIKSEVSADRNGGSSFWIEAVKYLNIKAADFPLWKNTCGANRNRKSGIKISAIGGDSRR